MLNKSSVRKYPDQSLKNHICQTFKSIPFLEKHNVKPASNRCTMQRCVIVTLGECSARVIIIRMPPSRVTEIYPKRCLKAKAFPSRNSSLVPDGVTHLALTTVALFLMLWLGNEL